MVVCFRLLSGNPLQCSCENMWMKQGRGDESEAAKLMCVEEGGKRRHLSKLILPNCGTTPFELKLHSRFSVNCVVTDKEICAELCISMPVDWGSIWLQVWNRFVAIAF